MRRYGQDTGNPASTFNEAKFALTNKKRIILIRMIPFDQKFEELQARQMFGLNKLEIPWMVGEPMSADLPGKIAEAMGQPAAGNVLELQRAGLRSAGGSGLGAVPATAPPAKPLGQPPNMAAPLSAAAAAGQQQGQ
eukprot:COSAG04_NODE_10923_length_743_cov_1.293478_1_plen_135_part_01